LEDFANMIGKNSEELAKLFGTTSQGAIEFSNLSKALRSTYIEDLAPLGLTVEQLNEQLLTSFTINRRSGNFQLMTDNQRIASGAALIKQMDRLAKLTGAQRDAIAEQLEAQLSNARFLAAIGDMPEKIQKEMQLFGAGIATIAPDLETGLLDLIATSGVPVTQAAQDLVKTIPGATSIIKQLEAGTIDNVTAMKLLQIEAQKSQEMFRDVAKTGQVEFIDGMFVGVNQLATAVLDTAAATGEGADAADKLTQELTEFQNAAKNLSSAFQGTQTSFLDFMGDLLGTGTGSLNEAMNTLAEDIKGLNKGTQAAVFAAKEIVTTGASMLRETAPITAGTYAALKLWGPMGPGYGFMGGGKGFMGKAAGFMGKAGGLGLGIGGTMMGGNIADQAESTGGKLLGVGSSAASGALAGAMFGPLGALIGGIAGGAYGAFRATDLDDKLMEAIGMKQQGTIGTTGNLRETRTNLSTIHAGERVLTKAETDAYLSSQATGGDSGALQTMNSTFNNMNTKMSAVVNEMKTFNKNVNTLVSINTDVARNTDKTQRRLANQTESIV